MKKNTANTALISSIVFSNEDGIIVGFKKFDTPQRQTEVNYEEHCQYPFKSALAMDAKGSAIKI